MIGNLKISQFLLVNAQGGGGGEKNGKEKGREEEEDQQKKCESHPLKLNTGALKAFKNVIRACPCKDCKTIELAEYLNFYYST